MKKKLVGFEFEERGIPRSGYNILDSQKNVIGKVTSGSMSPMMNKGIGLGYVQVGFHKPGSEILIEVRNKTLLAKVVKLPIYKKELN